QRFSAPPHWTHTHTHTDTAAAAAPPVLPFLLTSRLARRVCRHLGDGRGGGSGLGSLGSLGIGPGGAGCAGPARIEGEKLAADLAGRLGNMPHFQDDLSGSQRAALRSSLAWRRRRRMQMDCESPRPVIRPRFHQLARGTDAQVIDYIEVTL